MNWQSLVSLLKGTRLWCCQRKPGAIEISRPLQTLLFVCFLCCVVHFGVYPRAISSTAVTTDEDEELGVGGCRYRGKAKYNNLNDTKRALVPPPLSIVRVSTRQVLVVLRCYA